MYNITLICTVHNEIGKCNSEELYKILELIKPQVIFEELSNDLFVRFYQRVQTTNEPLEVRCIKKYLEKHEVKNIPIDINPNPNISTNEIEYMFDKFMSHQAYKSLNKEHNLLSEIEGFAYLNSKKCMELFNKMQGAEKQLMEFGISLNNLSSTYKLFHAEQANRENAMLNNIYTFSKENSYSQAVFFIGAAHRNSIMLKISEFVVKEKLKLNWTYYGDTI